MRRAARVLAIPVVAGMIYSWMLVQVVRDSKTILARRWWPGPPMDYP